MPRDDGSPGLRLVGESFHMAELEYVIRATFDGDFPEANEFDTDALLIREPDNPYDPHAIAVQVNGVTVGHIPKQKTQTIHMVFAIEEENHEPPEIVGKRRWFGEQIRPTVALATVVTIGWSRRDRIGVRISEHVPLGYTHAVTLDPDEHG